MVYKPDGSFNWTMVVAMVGVVGLVGGGVWWGATLSTQSAAQQMQINSIQTNFNTQMGSIQAALTTEETLIQTESIQLSRLGQKLDDLQATLSAKPLK